MVSKIGVFFVLYCCLRSCETSKSPSVQINKECCDRSCCVDGMEEDGVREEEEVECRFEVKRPKKDRTEQLGVNMPCLRINQGCNRNCIGDVSN